MECERTTTSDETWGGGGGGGEGDGQVAAPTATTRTTRVMVCRESRNNAKQTNKPLTTATD